jgi:ABC-type dipeptide/oligopeptide/nickel transport system permease component
MKGQSLKPLLTRLAYTLPVIWLVVSLVFLLIHLVLGDPSSKCSAKERPPETSPPSRNPIQQIEKPRTLPRRGFFVP